MAFLWQRDRTPSLNALPQAFRMEPYRIGISADELLCAQTIDRRRARQPFCFPLTKIHSNRSRSFFLASFSAVVRLRLAIDFSLSVENRPPLNLLLARSIYKSFGMRSGDYFRLP